MSIAVGGLMSGLDTNNIIEQLMTIERRPILKLQQREADYQVRLSAYGTLRSALNDLSSALQSMDTLTDLNKFSAVAGNSELFEASAGPNAVAGSYNITVQQLAQVHKVKSIGFGNSGPVGEGTMHLRVGTAAAIDIVFSSTDTLDDVAREINAAQAGVTASVVFDGTDRFLTLTAQNTGQENVINLTVTDADGVDTDLNGLSRLVYDRGVTENLVQTQNAEDAVISVDGVTDIHRPTNTISDVIANITLTLKNAPAAPDNATTLTVKRDASTAVARVNDFVNAYNAVVDFFKTNQRFDAATGTAGVLLGDGTTNSIRSRLNNMLKNVIPGIESGFKRLSDLGVGLNRDGYLEVDAAKLNAAFSDHFSDAARFFTQITTGSRGFSLRMIEGLKGILESVNGTLSARTKGIEKRITDIQDQVERMETRIQKSEARLRDQFNSLETLLAQYQTTSEYLNQQIIGLQNLNNYIANRK